MWIDFIINISVLNMDSFINSEMSISIIEILVFKLIDYRAIQ